MALGLNGTLLDDRAIRCQRYLPNKKEIVKVKKPNNVKESRGPKNNNISKKTNLKLNEKKKKFNTNITGGGNKFKNGGDETKKVKAKNMFQGKKVERTKKVNYIIYIFRNYTLNFYFIFIFFLEE